MGLESIVETQVKRSTWNVQPKRPRGARPTGLIGPTGLHFAADLLSEGDVTCGYLCALPFAMIRAAGFKTTSI
jgi:hypothetical protein